MKKNKMMRLASFLLVAVLLSTCAISGTFAKYVSTKNSTDTARVAKWSFTVGAADIATTDFDFDLFKTIADTNGGAYTDDAEVKNTGTDGKTLIAPGTWGYFDLVLTNASEVYASYAIDYTVTKSGIPVKFYVVTNPAAGTVTLPDGSVAWEDDLADVTATTLKYDTENTVTYRIYWKWDYTTGDAGDTADTTLGNAGTATLSVNAAITATQVD